jgi:TolB protein
MKFFFLLLCGASFTMIKPGTGVFKNHADVGKPHIKGSTAYEESTKTYTLKGGGYNIWFARDEFQYAYNKLKGDFTLTAHFEFVGKGKEAHRKIGWMIRESLADSAVHISGVLHGDGLTVLQWRVKAGMNMRDPEDEIRADSASYKVVQMQRVGKKVIMRVAAEDGAPFISVGEHEMQNLSSEVLAGIFICSHNPNAIEEAKISNVSIKN